MAITLLINLAKDAATLEYTIVDGNPVLPAISSGERVNCHEYGA